MHLKLKSVCKVHESHEHHEYMWYCIYEAVFSILYIQGVLGMIAIWDEEKNMENKAKHGISFNTAQYVFADPNRLERIDRSENNNSDELRIQTLGLVGKVLFVVFTERMESYRIISARYADKKERRIYNANGNERNSDWTKAD